MVPGAAASRHWVDENHSEDIGYPSYFEVHGGPGSQAYRCMVSQLEGEQPNPEDCEPASAQDLSVVQDKPELSAATAEVSGHLGSGQTVRPTLEMDASERSLFHLAWVTGTLTFTLTQPNGQVVSPAYAEAHPDVVTYTTSSGGDTLSPSAAYAFTTTVPGLYTATITADEVGAAGTDFLFAAALETSRVLTVTTNAELYQVGDTAVFTGSLRGPSGGITGADVQAQLGRLDGITDTLAFADLGNGKYGAAYAVPDVPGHLQATFTAVGDDGGTAFTRQVEALLAIAPYAAQLTGAYSDRPEDWDGDGFDDMLALDLGMTATEVGTHTLSADLVSGGQVIAHATHNTVLDSGVQTVTIRFDGWDIRRSGIDGPYTVTHVYLLDVGAGGIPSQVADDVWVTAAYGWHDFGFESQHLPLILKKH